MITGKELQQELQKLLNGKNLPLDLQVEILDHMTEQVIYKTDFERKSFAAAVAEIEEDWKADLKLKRLFFWKPNTRLQQQIRWRKEKSIFLKTVPYFCAYLLMSALLLFLDETVAGNFIFAVHFLAVAVFGIHCLFDFKIVKTLLGNRNDMRISFLQKGAQILFVSSLLIPNLILFDFNARFVKYTAGLRDLLYFFEVNQMSIAAIFIMNMVIFLWIYGYFFFLEYKKTVTFLQNKIHLKL